VLKGCDDDGGDDEADDDNDYDTGVKDKNVGTQIRSDLLLLRVDKHFYVLNSNFLPSALKTIEYKL
jgi:hypothetical protein